MDVYVLLFGFVLDIGKIIDIAGQFPDFGKGLFRQHRHPARPFDL
jgi:hypothetical protein